MIADAGNAWRVTVGNPVPDVKKEQLVVYLSAPLKEGRYEYQVGGVYPRKGEFVTITRAGSGCKVVAELADARDDEKYDYQAPLYNATPIVIDVPKD